MIGRGKNALNRLQIRWDPIQEPNQIYKDCSQSHAEQSPELGDWNSIGAVFRSIIAGKETPMKAFQWHLDTI